MSPRRRRLVAQRQRRKAWAHWVRTCRIQRNDYDNGLHVMAFQLNDDVLTLMVEPYDGPLIFHSPRVSFG